MVPDAETVERRDVVIEAEHLPVVPKMSMVRELLRRNAAREDR